MFESMKKREKGQTLTEFALVATVFLLLIFSIMQMANAIYAYNTICSAAQAAVRYGVVHPPASTSSSDVSSASSAVQTQAIQAAPGLNSSNLTVNVSWPTDAQNSNDQDAKVQISYNYTVSIPFMSSVTLPLTTTSQMMVSQNPGS